MSATKEIKTLLQDVRLQLDEESCAKVEPILRSILDASKPKTITQVEYRSDPKDEAQIEELRATIVAKDAMIRTLQAKLATPPPLKTITQVEYRCDPKDEAKIKELGATIVAKGAVIRKLQSQLAPPQLEHMSFDDQLREFDNRARAFAECATTCMRLMRGNETGWFRSKEVLERLIRLWNLSVGNYLRLLCDSRSWLR